MKSGRPPWSVLPLSRGKEVEDGYSDCLSNLPSARLGILILVRDVTLAPPGTVRQDGVRAVQVLRGAFFATTLAPPAGQVSNLL